MRETYPFIADIPSDEYHEAARRGEFLSSHLLSDFRHCPLLYHKKMAGLIEPKDSDALRLGRAIHTLILEGEAKFDEEFTVSGGPVNARTGEPYGKRTNAYREWLESQKKEVVDPEEYGFFGKLRESVWLHPIARRLLAKGRAEGTVRTRIDGEPVQIRMDWFNPDFEGGPVICDLKTCDSLDGFLRVGMEYSYPEQLAFYQEAFAAASGGVRPGIRFIAVEKREPYRCAVVMPTDDLVEQSRAKNRRALALLKECRATGLWPTGYEELQIWDAR